MLVYLCSHHSHDVMSLIATLQHAFSRALLNYSSSDDKRQEIERQSTFTVEAVSSLQWSEPLLVSTLMFVRPAGAPSTASEPFWDWTSAGPAMVTPGSKRKKLGKKAGFSVGLEWNNWSQSRDITSQSLIVGKCKRVLISCI